MNIPLRICLPFHRIIHTLLQLLALTGVARPAFWILCRPYTITFLLAFFLTCCTSRFLAGAFFTDGFRGCAAFEFVEDVFFVAHPDGFRWVGCQNRDWKTVSVFKPGVLTGIYGVL